jgi:heptosyltransferase-1
MDFLMKAASLKQSPRRILVCQLGTLRQALCSLPLTVDIRRQWPDAEIHWIIECAVDSLLQNHPCIDRIIRIERGWLKRPRYWRQLRDSLLSQQYDLAFDTLGLSKSSLLGWLSGAAVRIGFASPNGRELAPWLATHCVQAKARHRVDMVRELLSPWNEVVAGAGEFRIPRSLEDEHTVHRLLHHRGLLGEKNWYCLHPGAIAPHAQWPAERFAAIVSELYQKRGMKCVLLWLNEHERLLSEVIAETCLHGAMVAPRVSLPELAVVLQHAKFLLTNDSDSLQIASAVGGIAVSLHGPTWADEFGAYGPGNVAIQSPVPDVTRLGYQRDASTVIRGIDTDEVLYHIDRMTGRIDNRKAQLVA